MLHDIMILPDWINEKKQSHKDVWDTLGAIIAVISKCNINKILADRTIRGYNSEATDLVIDLITFVEGEAIELQASHFIINSINKYLALAIEYELYEVAENII